VFENPRERVLFWARRDANPFFHFFESLWMLAGRNDVAFLQQFVGRMKLFSDDGKRFHGAYGYRWRQHFDPSDVRLSGMDQLVILGERLAMDPTDRRSVLTMWDPTVDLGADGKDFPCNTHAYFSRNVRGELDMSILNRSNDVIWGLYGANAFHFSVLQEYMAARIGCHVGTYFHFSNNYHAYLNTFEPLRNMWDAKANGDAMSPYQMHGPELVYPYDWFQDCTINQWDEDLEAFFDGDGANFTPADVETPFWQDVVWPLWEAHRVYRETEGIIRYQAAISMVENCAAMDLHKACKEWLERRMAKFIGEQHG